MAIREFFSVGKRSGAKQARKSHANAQRASDSATVDGNRAPLNAHTLTSFDEALSALIAGVGEMGQRVTDMVEICAQIFLDRDVARAKSLIQADLEIDSQKEALIALALAVLARHRPVASDLRLVLAVEHVAGDLERTADHAKNIAKRALALTGRSKFDATISDLMRRLHASVKSMLSDALSAFTSQNAALAIELSRRDRIPDAIYDDLFHAVISRIQTSPADAPADVQALFVGKSLERIGDHATNIAEEARFLARGDIPGATRNR